MLEILHHKRNYLITTVVNGSICTSNHMFGRTIWDKLPNTIFEILEILKFLKIARVIYPKNRPNQKCGYWLITPKTLHIN